MRYFPAHFNFADRPVFVVGGGELAVRKIRLLRQANADIWAFSVPKNSSLYNAFGESITCLERDVEEEDFTARPAFIIIAEENKQISFAAHAKAKAANIPVNFVDEPDFCDIVVPSIVTRGDLAIGISTGGAAPVIGRRLRQRIETLLPKRLGDLLDFTRQRRERIAQKISTEKRRSFYEKLLAGPVAEDVLAGDMPSAAAKFEEVLAQPEVVDGIVHIVGAGPGDPELLTLKALRLLQEADVVLYDNLVSEDVLDLIRRDAERHYVGKRRADHSMPQEKIGDLMISLAKQGKRVVRLKGGDPFIFGRGGEELEQLKAAGVSAAVVPGITAATGCGAATSIPMTHRGVSQAVSFVTAYAGHGGAPDINWGALAQLKHTLVVYMGVSRAGDVTQSLIEGGRGASTPVAVIEKGTTSEQKILRTTLAAMPADMMQANILGPAILVIGEVAAFANGQGLIDLTQNTEIAA